MSSRPKLNEGAITLLIDIRRELAELLQRVDAALSGEDVSVRLKKKPSGSKRFPIPGTQTYPSGMDYRGDMEGLRGALTRLHDRVSWVDGHREVFGPGDLFKELCLRTAEARLLQIQTTENSREWETAVGVIRTLTRIVAATEPGFVYGLASTHNTDWGRKMEEIMSTYTPPHPE